MADCLKKGMSLGNIEIRKCPKCGAPMIKRNGKMGLFLGVLLIQIANILKNIDSKKNTKSTKKFKEKSSKSVSEQISSLRSLLN